MQHTLTNAELNQLVDNARLQIHAYFGTRPLYTYPIPRGGVPVAYLLMAATEGQVKVAETPEKADFFIDDIIDSGATMEHWCDKYPGLPFFALIDKTSGSPMWSDRWVIFPWEGEAVSSIEDNVRRLLQFIGEDPERGGLVETPARVAKAYGEWFDGYRVDIPSLFKTFEDGAENCDELIIIDSIPVESFCEHHIARFHGVAHVGYIPSITNGHPKIIGLSKIPKLVKAYAHRLQVQERLTNQIADAISKYLEPQGVAVILRCEHTCMSTRGACVQGSSTTTSAMRGVLRENSSARAEFLSLIPKV